MLGVLVGAYYYFLMQTANIALNQVQNLKTQYSYIAEHVDQIATGR